MPVRKWGRLLQNSSLSLSLSRSFSLSLYPAKTVNVNTSLYHLSISQQELPLGNLDPQWETDIGNEGVNANASCLEAKQQQRQQSFNILPSPPHAQGGPTVSRR